MFPFQRVCASIARRAAACGCAVVFAGPVSAQCVEAWGAMGDLDGTVEALITFNGELIAGGSFTEASGEPLNHIARWNGVQWAPIGAGFNAEVRALGVYRGEIVAGGAFSGWNRWSRPAGRRRGRSPRPAATSGTIG